MYVFYHGDMDGIASCNLYIRQNLIKDFQALTRISVYKFEYDKQQAIIDVFKRTMGSGQNNEEVVFVDCCPNEDVLKFLSSKTLKNIIILDHHITNKPLFDKYFQQGIITGISYMGVSATLIVWAWFYFKKDIETILLFLDRYKTSLRNQDDSPVPLSIKLINSWDIWDNLRVDAEAYKTYFEAQDYNPLENDKEVENLMDDDVTIKKAILNGSLMVQFFHQWSNIYCKRYGYPVKYKTNDFFVLNIGNANSKVFGDIIDDYDAVITYCNNGIKYNCSIYASEKSEFDCASFAEQFGGGGHKKAAGFVLDELPIWLRDRKLGLVFKEGGTKDGNKRRGRPRKTSK